MKGYFNNPELKRSSIMLLILMAILLAVSVFSLRLHHESLKKAYIRDFGAIAARIIDKNPELEKDVMEIVSKGALEEEVIKGEGILRKYGITEDLESELFPKISEVAGRNSYSIYLVFVILTMVLFFLNYSQYVFLYKRIRRLTYGAKKVVEGDYDIAIYEDEEGDFAKLAVSFNNMRQIIRNNIMELNKEKEFLVDILSDISHQLKTPLSSMIVYNDIMLNKELSKEQTKTFLFNNQNQLQRMKWLIKSILKLAKLDAKAIGLVKEEQSLNETLQESIEALESKAYEGRIKINFNEKDEIVFNHDRLWLEEALINIIKNGIEHTNEGGEINIELIENPVYRRIIIKDNGEGIKEEDLPNIFKRFYKVKTSRKSDSIGIGLSLAKSIIELHNGLIECESRLGEGTKFIITFLKY